MRIQILVGFSVSIAEYRVFLSTARHETRVSRDDSFPN